MVAPCLRCIWWEGKCLRNTRDFHRCAWDDRGRYPLFFVKEPTGSIPVCQDCHTPMIISDWDGWVWMCPFCDYQGREATDDEILAQEKALEVHEAKNMSHNAGCGAQDHDKEG